jgi:hypothetical protein
MLPLYGKFHRLFTRVFRFEELCSPFEVPWKNAKDLTLRRVPWQVAARLPHLPECASLILET